MISQVTSFVWTIHPVDDHSNELDFSHSKSYFRTDTISLARSDGIFVPGCTLTVKDSIVIGSVLCDVNVDPIQ